STTIRRTRRRATPRGRQRASAAWPAALPLPRKYKPVATHIVAVGHETPPSWDPWLPDGAGGRLGAHDLPFHVSASGASALRLPANGVAPIRPTATQLCTAVHETQSSVPRVTPAGSFRSAPAHFAPFHTSAIGRLVFTSAPTATQLLAALHETDTSRCFGAAAA